MKVAFERMHVTLIRVFSVVILIMISDTWGWANTGQLNELSFDKEIPLILLPVKFNGKKHLFLLDTGTTYTMYDLSLKKELGDVRKREEVRTPGGKSVLELYDAPEAYLGAHNIGGQWQSGLHGSHDGQFHSRKEGKRFHWNGFLEKTCNPN